MENQIETQTMKPGLGMMSANALSIDSESHLSPEQIAKLKKTLLDEMDRIESKLLDQRKKQIKLDASTDSVDSANDNILVASQLRFSNRENFYLKKIKNALERIQKQEYGTCEECGSDINFQRLNARPTSELCLTCKEENEREENQNFFLRQSKSIGKKMEFSSNS